MRSIIAVAALLLAAPLAAQATNFNDQTLCRAMATALAQQNLMDIRRGEAYIATAIGVLDRAEVALGQQSLVILLTADEALSMVQQTALLCVKSPEITVRMAMATVFAVSSVAGPGAPLKH